MSCTCIAARLGPLTTCTVLSAHTGLVCGDSMAAAIVGGMSVSTIFTLLLLPSLLQLQLKPWKLPAGLRRVAAGES